MIVADFSAAVSVWCNGIMVGIGDWTKKRRSLLVAQPRTLSSGAEARRPRAP